MIPKQVDFLAISKLDWERYPQDRPFASLVLDVDGAARRILKGVNPQIERTRFSQLCNYFESAVLDLHQCSSGSPSRDPRFPQASRTKLMTLTLTDNPALLLASGYINALHFEAEASEETLESMQRHRSIFAPGDLVEQHVATLAQLQSELDRSILSEKQAELRSIELVLRFFQNACDDDHGVVTVIGLLPN